MTTNPYGPDRKELWFWLIFGSAGLAFTAFAIWYRGLPIGPAGWEAMILGFGLFGFLTGRSVWRLFLRRDP
ncbi:MAG: hypothetical protein AAF761_10610 [Pseudomonadota bacterium]